jgi:hypothetical protein
MAVETYREVDEALSRAVEEAFYAAGLAAGAALPFAALGLLASPSGTALLAWYLSDPDRRSEVLTDLDRTLYDNPWLLEALTRAAPGLVQGTAGTLTGGSPMLLALLTDGAWPSSDYHSSLLGLVTLARRYGYLTDAGSFRTRPPTDWGRADLRSGHLLQDLVAGQVLAANKAGDEAAVRIVRVPRPGGGFAYVVQVPGTQEMTTLRHEGTLLDMDSNINLMYLQGQAGRAQVQHQVEAAMLAAGLGPGDPVKLNGHSQGGIIAASIAANPEHAWDVRSVVTAGSPIARIPIPQDVHVMSLEHHQDVIPRLDGRDNPALDNWVTVTGDPATTSRVEDAHSLDRYLGLAASIDRDTDASLQDWRDRNDGLFTGDGAQATTVRIERVP